MSISKKFTVKEAVAKINERLQKYYNISIEDAKDDQIYTALSRFLIDEILQKKQKFCSESKEKGKKAVNYLCMEFLTGKNLETQLYNLGVRDIFAKALKLKNKNLEDIFDVENDAGLGNGGLGRLACCYLDSLATLNYPVMGHCIRYDYGLFKQKIIDGKQVEVPDEWLDFGSVWQIPRQDKACVVRIGGKVKEFLQDGKFKVEYQDCTEIEAFPYDLTLSGYDSKGVAILRLWSARSMGKFNATKFSQGDYAQAFAEKNDIEMISKILYPVDNHFEGKLLRLKQQYFLASAAMQSIVNSHLKRHNLKCLSKYVAIHINDTHPVFCVPELMRILMDENDFSWDEAWSVVTSVVSYTNHTILKESLETWDEKIVFDTIPRIYSIIKEIDRRFRIQCAEKKIPQNEIEEMTVVSNGRISMTNLAIISSYKVNGVSSLHTKILQSQVLDEFGRYQKDKFLSITNGITFRRWLGQCNDNLTNLINNLIGDRYIKSSNDLSKLGRYTNENEVVKRLKEIKIKNKKAFAKYILKTQNVVVDPNSRFDVQAKRIHEYKRQLLNILKIVYIYSILKKNPDADITPQTFFFSGKAASGYKIAKDIIYLINKLSNEINKDEKISKKLKVVFVENYSISVAEKLMPATDVSEQISLAGQEASGTGNMKAVLNGALMICTEDGANIELIDKCGENSAFTFGMSSSEVDRLNNYNPKTYYENDERIKTVIDMLRIGFDGESFSNIADYLLNNGGDRYKCLADFDSYLKAHEKMDELYRKPNLWHKQCIKNISSMAYFSSDRAIEEYAKDVWNLTKLK